MTDYAVAVGYARVSTERQASEERTSLADQERAIRTLADRFGVPLDRWFRNAGASGATAERRPAFMEMLRHCEANPMTGKRLGVILVLNDSRWGRFPDPDEAAYWRVVLRRLGWDVRFAEGDDIENPVMRSIVRSIGRAQASEYRQNIRANAKRGARSSAERGYWTAEAPLGYRRRVVTPGRERVLDVGVRKAPDERVMLTPGPEEEVALVRWAFETYAAGTCSLGQLAAQLRTRWPARPWCTTTVHQLLRNNVYQGDVAFGKRTTDPIVPGRILRTGQGEWYGMRDAHPALISRALFTTVQQRLRLNASRFRRTRRGDYRVAWIVTCAVCGEAMVGGGGTSPERDPEGRWNFYRCRGVRLRGSPCYGTSASVARRVLEPAVIRTVVREVQRPRVQAELRSALDAALLDTTARSSAQRRRLEKQRADLQRKLDNVVQAIATGTLTSREAESTLTRLRGQVGLTEQELQALRFESRQLATIEAERDRLLQLAQDLPTLVDRLPGPTLREILGLWVARAAFDKRDRSLTMHIRKVPTQALLQPSEPRPVGRQQDLIVRRLDLRQPRPGRQVAAGGRR